MRNLQVPASLRSPTSRPETPNLHRVKDRGFSQRRYRLDDTGQFGEGNRGESENARLAIDTHDTLVKHYPDHPWFVAANARQGIVSIQLPAITQYSWVIKIADNPSAEEFERRVMRGGGAFLEAYNIPRAGFDMDLYRNLLCDNPHLGSMNKQNPEEFRSGEGHKTPEMKLVETELRKLQRDIEGGHVDPSAAITDRVPV